MKKWQKFLWFWLVDLIILYLAELFLKGNVTIGNSIFAPYQSLVFASFVWTAFLMKTNHLLKGMEIPAKSNNELMVAYFVMNFVILWFIARFSFFTGVGIASFWYVAGIALVGNFAQYFTMQYTDKK